MEPRRVSLLDFFAQSAYLYFWSVYILYTHTAFWGTLDSNNFFSPFWNLYQINFLEIYISIKRKDVLLFFKMISSHNAAFLLTNMDSESETLKFYQNIVNTMKMKNLNKKFRRKDVWNVLGVKIKKQGLYASNINKMFISSIIQ